jgi:hypothetical protein
MITLVGRANQLLPIASSTLDAVKICGSMMGSLPLPA